MLNYKFYFTRTKIALSFYSYKLAFNKLVTIIDLWSILPPMMI